MSDEEPKLEPILLRQGARYRCFGDGLCCTDVHALGPISDDERVKLELIRDDVVRYNPLVEANVLATSNDGRCIFLGEQGCSLHEPLDGALKPVGCSRFPLGLTATPRGARVLMEHRCPCTLMGDRPVMSAQSVTQALGGEDGVRAQHIVTRVRLNAEEEVDFDRYVEEERPVLESLREGDLLSALGREPFPPLGEHDWDSLAAGMMALSIGGRFEAALRWFGHGLISRGGDIEETLDRPWSDAFDRAEARSQPATDPDEPFRIFVADAIWSLFWTEHGHFERARTEIATRLAVGLAIARRLRAEGVRADRAAAEAVVVIDLVGTSDWWLAAIEEL